mmetsp:Transcript_13365/g.28997  ORF Transcript_13365/g.28997 Transcript_13365/m.28997 type:complete len:250 (+) Transcript_13365:2200-2949(+)
MSFRCCKFQNGISASRTWLWMSAPDPLSGTCNDERSGLSIGLLGIGSGGSTSFCKGSATGFSSKLRWTKSENSSSSSENKFALSTGTTRARFLSPCDLDLDRAAVSLGLALGAEAAPAFFGASPFALFPSAAGCAAVTAATRDRAICKSEDTLDPGDGAGGATFFRVAHIFGALRALPFRVPAPDADLLPDGSYKLLVSGFEIIRPDRDTLGTPVATPPAMTTVCAHREHTTKYTCFKGCSITARCVRI